MKITFQQKKALQYVFITHTKYVRITHLYVTRTHLIQEHFPTREVGDPGVQG